MRDKTGYQPGHAATSRGFVTVTLDDLLNRSDNVYHHADRNQRPSVHSHRRGRAGDRRSDQAGSLDASALTITAIVPAYNEEDGIGATLEAMLRQTVPFDEIIVVDDGSKDRTAAIARGYGVTVLQPPANLGSKARAQNFGLWECRTDLVLPVDADTVLADDYVEQMKPVFADPNVKVAAGAVRTQFQNTLWERGRDIEYLTGFHWYRPIQDMVGAPAVCSGCCSVFRREELFEFGGFPERTMVEDIDYTWSTQIAGGQARYVPNAVAYAAEPTSLKYLGVQLWRWKSGWFQNVRLHYGGAIRHKPMLALWITLSLFDIVISPFTLALPVLWLTVFHRSAITVLEIATISEAVVMGPALTAAVFKRKLNPLRVAACYPAYYLMKFINAYYDWRALAVELIGVPLGLTRGLVKYEKGRAEGPTESERVLELVA